MSSTEAERKFTSIIDEISSLIGEYDVFYDGVDSKHQIAEFIFVDRNEVRIVYFKPCSDEKIQNKFTYLTVNMCVDKHKRDSFINRFTFFDSIIGNDCSIDVIRSLIRVIDKTYVETISLNELAV